MTEIWLTDEDGEQVTLSQVFEKLAPSSLAARLDRDRPYDGQPHTDQGERGRTEVRGISFRDLTDCFIRALFDSTGKSPSEWPGSVYDLDLNDLDPIAISQNLACWVERYMGIYPNVPQCEAQS